MSETSCYLFKGEDAKSRSITLDLGADGALKLYLLSALSKDGDDYEEWVTIQPRAVSRLALVLLRDRFAGHEYAVEEIQEYCEQNAVENEHMIWQGRS